MTRVTCSNCSASWDKRTDSMAAWHGRCRACTQKFRASLPGEKEKRSASAKALLSRIGKIRNSGSNPRRGEFNHRWAGGKPTCVDCGKKLTVATATRCRQCYGKSRRGIPRSTEAVIKMRASARRGEDHPNWKGGVRKDAPSRTLTPEHLAWRRSVMRRDLYTCQMCGLTNPRKLRGVFHVDHIKPWLSNPELRLDLSNGRTLCVPCHHQTPTYGRQS